MADTLLRTYGKSDDSTFILDNFDVIFCPIINIDGYEYTWTDDRFEMEKLNWQCGPIAPIILFLKIKKITFIFYVYLPPSLSSM